MRKMYIERCFAVTFLRKEIALPCPLPRFDTVDFASLLPACEDEEFPEVLSNFGSHRLAALLAPRADNIF